MARVLTLAALLSLSAQFAEGEVVRVSIHDSSAEAAAAVEKDGTTGGGRGREEKWRRVAAGGRAGEPDGICRNINCPNSTICREVNPSCTICGFDERCHSGSVCNNRCDRDDQCGGECSDCLNRRCTNARKCSYYLCNYDSDCSEYPGECSQCGKDGVCHTNSGICGVACNTDRDCGGDCTSCKFGQCGRSTVPSWRPPHSAPWRVPYSQPGNYPREYPHSNYPWQYPNFKPPPPSRYPHEAPRSYPSEYPNYPSNNYPREYPAIPGGYPWDARVRAPKPSHDIVESGATNAAKNGEKGATDHTTTGAGEQKQQHR